MGVQKGEYDNDQVLLDLVRATAERSDRDKHGKGLQNFSYGAALSEFASTCVITSRRLYQQLAKHFQLPNERSLW